MKLERQWARRDVLETGEKTSGETGEDVEPEPEENNDDGLTITRLDVKSKSNMSDAELCQYFNSKLQKTESSDCGNRNCDCLAILTNRQVRSAVLRYSSGFCLPPSKDNPDTTSFKWVTYLPFL